MKVEEALIHGKKFLHKSDVLFLLANVLFIAPLEVYTSLDRVLTEEEQKMYLDMVDARANDYPLQYIIGTVNFLGNEFLVRENVLIPRFETEELVEVATKYINYEHKTLIDLGCGAGVIGISIKKKFPHLKVDMVDFNGDAVLLSRDNAKKLDVDVNVKEMDMFRALENEYDVYISNPPYLTYGEASEEVVKYEPHSALFAEDNGLYYYKRILDTIKFRENTLLIFEINDGQGSAIKEYAAKYNLSVILKRDLQDRERILIIYRSNNG